MTECLDEFDAPSPMPTKFCSRISLTEYEENASRNTETGLKDLLEYLQYNPTVYYEIMAKRKREELDNAGFLSYLRSRLTEWYTGSSTETVDPEQAKKQLNDLKDSIVKSFNYCQEAKGSTRRFSARIAEKRWRKVNHGKKDTKHIPPINSKLDFESVASENSNTYSSMVKKSKEQPNADNCVTLRFPLPPTHTNGDAQTRGPIPSSQQSILTVPRGVPPPPPPPPPPQAHSLPSARISKTLSKPTDKKVEQLLKNSASVDHRESTLSDSKILSQKRKLKSVSRTTNHQTSASSSNGNGEGGYTRIMDAIKNPDSRAALKQISGNKPGSWVTPPRKKHTSDSSNMFNLELLRKFQNAKSPVGTDSPGFDVTFTP